MVQKHAMIKAETLTLDGEVQNQTKWRYYALDHVKEGDMWELHRK
jgi:hypothetical protein